MECLVVEACILIDDPETIERIRKAKHDTADRLTPLLLRMEVAAGR